MLTRPPLPLDSALPIARDPRLAMIVGIETFLANLRYIAYAVLFLLLLTGYVALGSPEFYALAATGLMHNGFVAWVLYTRRPHLFQSPLNFGIYLVEVSLLVGLAGPSHSPMFVMYLLFIIGFATYSRRLQGAATVTLLCLGFFGLTLAAEYYFVGWRAPWHWIVARAVAIAACGWMVGTLSEFLRRTEIEREEQAEMLASSEATLRTILDSTEQPILVFDDDEIITETNERATHFFDAPRDRLLGQRFRTFLFDDGLLPHKIATVRTRGSYRGEAVAELPSGSERDVELNLRSFRQDNVRYYVALLHDITESKNLQEASRLATLRLEQINEELRHISELKSVFFSNVSRRLRSPLSAILGFTDMLLQEDLGPLQPEQREALQLSRDSVLRVFRMLDQAFAPGGEPKQNGGTHAPVETPLPAHSVGDESAR